MKLKYILSAVLLAICLIILYFSLIPALPQGKYLSANCKIYNLDGELLREFNGVECVYFSDGSWMNLETNGRVNFFNKKGDLVNTIKENGLCCLLTGVEKDQAIFISNESVNYLGYEKVKFDELVKVDKEGNIKSRLKLYSHIDFLRSKLDMRSKVKPYKITWKASVNFDFVGTHISSISENKMDIIINGVTVAPKGSYTLFSYIGYRGIIIVDKDLKGILYARPLAVTIAHDLHFTGANKVLFFENSTRKMNNKNPNSQKFENGIWAKLVEVDLEKKKRVVTIDSGFFSELGGGGRRLSKNVYIVFDTKPVDNLKGLKLTGQTASMSRKRVNYYSPMHGVFKKFEIDNAVETPKVLELDNFLKNNAQKK